MAMTRQDKVDLTIEILKVAGIVSLTIAAIIAPPGAAAVAKLIESFSKDFDRYDSSNKWRYRDRAKRAISSLRRRGLIVTQSKGEELVVKLTQAGRRFLRRYNVNHLTIDRPAQWDGWWRVVVFDISETNRAIRNAVRDWLKRVGFARLQKSVWVIPWPCRKEFDLLCAEYKLGTTAILLETRTIARERALKRLFNLS